MKIFAQGKFIAVLLLLSIFIEASYSQQLYGSCGVKNNSVKNNTNNFPFKPARTPLPAQYLNILIVYVTFADDNFVSFIDSSFWLPHQMPVSPNNGIPILHRTEMSPSVPFMDRYPAYTVSDYFCEMSLGQLDVIGDEVLVNLPNPVSYYKDTANHLNGYDRMNMHILKNYVDTMAGINFADYDNWDFDTTLNQWIHSNDSIVDMVVINYRHTFNDGWFWNTDWSGVWDLGFEDDSLVLDNRKINASFSVNGSGVTVALGNLWNYSGMVNAMIHEICHHFFVDNLSDAHHSWTGLMTGFSETSFNMSPDERTCLTLGWLNPVTVIPPAINTITIRDYISTGDVYKIQLPGLQEYFWLANHQKRSLYDGISRGSSRCYQINKSWQNPYCSEGKGLYIYHEKNSNCESYQYCGNPPPQPVSRKFDLENADGKYNWVKIRDVNYYVPGFNFTIPIFEPVVNGGNPLGMEEYNKVIRLNNACGMQEVTDDPCNLSDDINDYIVTIDKSGDGLDGFNIGYDEIFSPYSNPNSNACTGSSSNITVNLISQNSNGDITIRIYFNNTQALLELPPAKVKNLKAVKQIINQTTGEFHPKLTWDLNSEPDFTGASGLPGSYRIYRGVSTVCSLEVEPAYTLIATLGATVNEFIDNSVTLFPPGNTGQTCEGRLRSYSYKVEAVDNTNKTSVKSDRKIINGFTEPCIQLPIGINNNSSSIPEKFSVYNYPNPFNPSTHIKYELPVSGNVTIKIYNPIGEEIRMLVSSEYKTVGRYISSFDGTNLPSGVYFYKIEVSDKSNILLFTETKKMVLVK